MKRVLLIALMLAGCNVGPDPVEIERVRKGTDTVRSTLKLPETAQFKGVAAHGEVVCGEVNGSVGFGRTGYERFVVKSGKVTLASQLPTEQEMDALWAKECK